MCVAEYLEKGSPFMQEFTTGLPQDTNPIIIFNLKNKKKIKKKKKKKKKTGNPRQVCLELEYVA